MIIKSFTNILPRINTIWFNERFRKLDQLLNTPDWYKSIFKIHMNRTRPRGRPRGGERGLRTDQHDVHITSFANTFWTWSASDCSTESVDGQDDPVREAARKRTAVINFVGLPCPKGFWVQAIPQGSQQNLLKTPIGWPRPPWPTVRWSAWSSFTKTICPSPRPP